MQQALDQDRLQLHYQPVVNLASGKVEGVEAQISLDYGVLAPIWPTTFIPIAESYGLLLPIGAWVAEGIETQAALHYLQERSCQQGQGYYFSSAATAAPARGVVQEALAGGASVKRMRDNGGKQQESNLRENV